MKAARLMGLLLLGCAVGTPGKEQLGDEAWHDARWSDAVAAYRGAGNSPRLDAKMADAALQGGMLAESAQAWIRLGTEAPDRAAEAAAGLVRVATAAENDGKTAALAQAVLGLRRISPDWPAGRVSARLGQLPVMPPGDAVVVIPAVLSATPGRGVAEPLLVALARANRSRGSCDVAVPILEGVLRTTTTAGLRDTATTNLAWCELALGLNALAAGHPGDAERWLDRASHRGSDAGVGRRALVGFGDARAAQGDTIAARTAWQDAVAGTDDSIAVLARQRLQLSPAKPAADTGTVHPVTP